MSTFVDPRARMRDALRLLVQQGEPAWDESSLLRFRNLLLDETGSDARPLADLLLEAIRRGWRDLLPPGPMESARWDALASPFVMRWSAERFVQQEMARWAAESWGFALGVIGIEQVRIAPPASPVTMPVATGAVSPRARANSTAALPPARPISFGGATTAAPGAARSNPAPSRPTAPRPTVRPQPIARRPAAGPARSTIPQLNPKFVRNLAIVAGSSYLLFIAQMVITIRGDRRDAAAAATRVASQPVTDSAAGAIAGGASDVASDVPGDSVVSSGTPASAPFATAPVAKVPGGVPVGGVPVRAPSGAPILASAPGVPSITRNALPGTTNDGRMLIVEPARRASGSSVPTRATTLAPTRKDPIAYDEMQLTDGSRIIGRVDIVRAGSVIFRDMRTGLRHEINKDDIEQIITEFGTPVRFRTNGSSATVAATPERTPATSARAAAATGVRARGVAGRYAVRYEAAVAKGSKECTSVWSRSPQTVDYATVAHIPGADTLTVSFDGGDNFPSNVDQEGFFASTPRIMPDQARTSTALVTRLNGRFPSNGSLSLTVSIVFFRRMRAGPDLACTVYVNGTGTRLPS